MVTEILRMENICKYYAGNKVLDNASLSIKQGEVMALMGKNGGGKTTIAQIMSGTLAAESGTIYFKDHPVRISSPLAAQKLGISIAHQEPDIVPGLDVAQNIFLGSEHTTAIGSLDHKYMYRESRRILDKLHVDFDEHTMMSELSFTQWQIVTIAKALRSKPMLLILDEVTTSFTNQEFEVIENMMRILKMDDISILFISHNVGEVLKVADRVGVICDGMMMGTFDIEKCSKDMLITLMTAGKSIKQPQRYDDPKAIGSTVLELKNVSGGHGLHDINFSLKRGEILGIAGLMGSGRTSLLKLLFGLNPKTCGQIIIRGKQIERYNSVVAVRNNIGMMPEERMRQGIFFNLDLGFNLTLAALDKCSRFGVISHRVRRYLANYYIHKLHIVSNGMETDMKKLSGGNQQKTILGRYLAFKPDIIIMDEPTKGIDIVSKAEIMTFIDDLSREGKSIILVSSEITELFDVCDRIVIIRSGTLVGEIERNDFMEADVLTKALF